MENIKCKYFGDEKICENNEYYKNYCAFGKEPKSVLNKFYNRKNYLKLF